MRNKILKELIMIALLIGLCKSTTTKAQTGAAINFDGVNDNVQLNNAAALQLNNGTVEAWIKIPVSGAGFSHRSIVVKQYAYGLFLNNNVLAAYNWATAATYSAGIALNDNNWHHVAFSFQNGITNGSRLYIDGLAVGAPFTYSISNQNTFLAIGGNPWPGQFLNGTIDEVRIWNTLRTPCEISTYMNYEIPTTAPGLVANYHFNQGIASGINSTVTTLTDFSGNAFTGTLTNIALTGSTSNWVAPSSVANGNYFTPVSISGPTSICLGSSATLNASGSFPSFSWFSGPSIASYIVTPSLTTTYSVVASNSLGCQSNIVTHTLTVLPLPTITAVSNTLLLCTGNSSTLTANGAVTYTWNNNSNSPSIVINPTTTTSYTVSGTSSVGCTNSVAITQSVSICTDINEFFNENKTLVKAYPNPSNYEVFITSDQELNLKLINNVGALIETINLNQGNNRSVKINKLESGLYILISNDNNLKLKIIISK